MKTLSKSSVIKKILKDDNDTLYVTSAGYISRLLYNIEDSPRNFYMMGSMGSALAFAIGIALNTDRVITVIAGDGEILMNLGTLVLLNKLQRENQFNGWVRLVILDDNQYESTGGQKTCSNYVDFQKLAICEVYKITEKDKPTERIELEPKEIARRFYRYVNGS